jgi:hypothetical protein
LQREDKTYHIFFEDIIGLIERTPEDRNDLLGTHKLVTSKIRIYNRSGVVENGSTTFYATLSEEFCQLFVHYLERSHRSA